MKQLVIISGKGGTGKTSITASLATLAAAEHTAVFADCDVDAADLHLLLNPHHDSSLPFISGNSAVINPDRCTACGVCAEVCRFAAVNQLDGNYTIDPISCEGCGVCVHFCPQHTIDFPPQRCGQWFISTTRFGPMVHAALDIGAENSGKLVSLVRQEARKLAEQNGSELVLIDGPPGTGCPVIAATTGCDAALIITEPTCSGKHDMERVLQLTRHFGIATYVCVNKWDINPSMSEEIKQATAAAGARFLGLIPYDRHITAAQIDGKTVVEAGNSIAAIAIEELWQKLRQKLELNHTTGE